jgi:hypothetical protein
LLRRNGAATRKLTLGEATNERSDHTQRTCEGRICCVDPRFGNPSCRYSRRGVQVGRFLARLEIGRPGKGGEFTSALSSDRMTAESSGLAANAAPASNQDQETKALRE